MLIDLGKLVSEGRRLVLVKGVFSNGLSLLGWLISNLLNVVLVWLVVRLVKEKLLFWWVLVNFL